MNKSRKKSLLLAVSLTLVIILLIGGTVAWLTDARRVENKLGIGLDGDGDKLVALKLTEPSYEEALYGGDWDAIKTALDGLTPVGGEYILDSIVTDSEAKLVYKKDAKDNYILLRTENPNLMPGDQMAKDPVIEVTGTKPVYLRARAYIELKDDQGAVTRFDAFTHEFTSGTDSLGLEIKDTADWTNHGDAFWYYYKADVSGNTQTAIDNTTAPLSFFKQGHGTAADGTTAWDATTSLMVPTTWGVDTINKIFEAGGLSIIVDAQVIQSDNYEPDFTAADAWDTSAVVPFTASIGG